jgi:lysozyme family protein
MNFDEAFNFLIVHEGGFSDSKLDPGGKTKFGVTEAVARTAGYKGDMKDLTLNMAAEIAKHLYWEPVRAEELPEAIRYAVFDCAYHSGVTQSVRFLQRSVKSDADGIIGPDTMAKIAVMKPEVLKSKLLSQRLTFLTNLPTWNTFGKGWARRIAAIMET